MRRNTTTGSVLSIPQYGWMKGAFNDRTVICAESGGTDICVACTPCSFPATLYITWAHSHIFDPSLPVHAGEMQGKVLGMAVGIFDEAGKDIPETGIAGELVCTMPHPSVPVRFWGDDARGSMFLKAYYDTYLGVWRHGDFIAMNPRTKGLNNPRPQVRTLFLPTCIPASFSCVC